MTYTWQDVMLNIDTTAEARLEQKRLDDIHAEQQRESSLASGWGLGLGILGMILGFGPAGFYVGKEIGKYGADLAVDWESMRIDPGKFYTEDAEEINQNIVDAAQDQTSAQIVDSIINLASWYVASGGLTAEKGEWDSTTWGSGDAEWSLYGEDPTPIIGEEVATLAPGPAGSFPLRSVDVTPVTFEGGHPSLFEGWNTEETFIKNVGDIGTKVYSDVIAKPTAIDRLAKGVINNGT